MNIDTSNNAASNTGTSNIGNETITNNTAGHQMLAGKAFAAPEAKAQLSDAADAYRELRSTFEAFRDTNDQRLGDIEQRASADVLLD